MADFAPLLICASAAIVLLLGSAHLAYTFIGRRLHPRADRVRLAMAAEPLVISRATTVWRAWIGFNASHSQGAILFGLVYGYLALRAPQVLLQSPVLKGAGLAMLLGYCWLAHRYWFRTPLAGLTLATALYTAALALAALH